MDINKAFEILEINIKYTDLTPRFLKKQYRKMALKYHPDKNGNTNESNEHFKNINEAFTYLNNDFNIYYNINSNKYDDTELYNSQTNYLNVLKDFIKSVMENNDYVDILVIIIHNIITMGKKLSLKLFEDLNKEVVFTIYVFLSKYREVFNLNNDLIDYIHNILRDKYKNVEIYKFNPSITDLMQNNFYKLYIEDELFLVPLWYYESHFDYSNNEIIAICEPNLPNSMTIDDDNNLIVELKFNKEEIINMIMDERYISIKIGGNNYEVNISKLYMKKEQLYYLKNCGLAKIKNDIYDVVERADVILKICIV